MQSQKECLNDSCSREHFFFLKTTFYDLEATDIEWSEYIISLV